MDQTPLLAFKLPFLRTVTDKGAKKHETQSDQGNKANQKTIGIIDSSGSMAEWWVWVARLWNTVIPKENLLTVTFSNKPQIEESNELNENISKHQGGGTEIVPAFQVLEKELALIPLGTSVTVIFISDGQDNKMATIETRMKIALKGNVTGLNLNFICLGVQKGFPTSLAMNLRELYHRGDPQIPAVYLIEYASEQAFFNKFETIKQYLQSTQLLKLNRIVNLFPYDEQITQEAFEGQWVVSRKQGLIINDDINIEGLPFNELEIEDIIDLFRSWIQNLQLQIMKDNEQAVDFAQKSFEIMTDIVTNISNNFGFNILQITQEQINDTTVPFNLRAKYTFIYKYGNKIRFFLDEAQSLAKGINPNQLSEFEQAKRLQLGTITGKHFQKALALKGITIDEFKKMKEEFVSILVNCNFKPDNEQGQERSVVTLENQRDVLADKKQIIEGLKYVKSQYDFAETFPLIGHGIKVKRLEGSQVNPWIVLVQSIAQQNKVIDSGYLIKNNFVVELNTGGNKKEEINCILPLYHSTDDDLQPILRSRIIKLLMTFMVQQNIDTYYEETYLALLASAQVCLYKLEPSKWQDETLDLIHSTIKIVYQGTECFETYLQKYLNVPNESLVKENEYEESIAVSKQFIYLTFAVKENLIKDFEARIEHLILYVFHRDIKKHHDKLGEYFQIKLGAEDSEKLKQTLNIAMKKYSYLAAFNKSLSKEINSYVKQFYYSKELKVEIKEAKLYSAVTNFNLSVIEGFYAKVTGKKFDTSRYNHIAYHAITVENLFETPINYENMEVIKKAIEAACLGQVNNSFSFIKEYLQKEYFTQFVKTHQIVRPFTAEALQQECLKRNQDVTKIHFSPATGLASNCCFAVECPFYLQPMNKDIFRKHINNWQGHIPFGFHGFVRAQLLQDKTHNQIYSLAETHWLGFPDKYLADKAIVMDYIEQIKIGIA